VEDRLSEVVGGQVVEVKEDDGSGRGPKVAASIRLARQARARARALGPLRAAIAPGTTEAEQVVLSEAVLSSRAHGAPCVHAVARRVSQHL